MHRVLFHIGGLTVYSYGVFIALAFILATVVGRYRFTEQYRDPDIMLDLVLAAVIGGVLGARIFYVIGHWSRYAEKPGQILKINMDGLVFYGGLLLGLALTILVARWKKVRFWTVLDLAGLCVPLALAVGRIGCFLNGCCYGKPTGLPWGVTFPVLPGARHPTQIYELVLDLVLFGLIWWKRDGFTRDGTAFFCFIMGYSFIRFLMEFFREHEQARAGLAFQIASLSLFVAAGLIMLFRYRLLPAASSRDLPFHT